MEILPELQYATQKVISIQEQTMCVDPFEKAIGVAQGTIKNLKNGKTKSVSADCLLKVAKYCNVSVDYLLGLSNEPTPLKQVEIAERPTALSPVLAELSQDKDFVYAAKVYKAVDEEYKKRICIYILGMAEALGVNIA